jgi:hypothetical protein
LAAGGAQLVLVPMQPDRAPLLGGSAAPAQRAVLTPAGKAGLARAGDRRGVARRTPDGPACRSIRKSWMVNPPGTALWSGMGLIVWAWPAARSAARVAPDP